MSTGRIEFALNRHVRLRVQRNYPLDHDDIVKLNTCYNLALLYLATTLRELNLFRDEIDQLRGKRRKQKVPDELMGRHQHMILMLKDHFKIDTNTSVVHVIKILDQVLRKLWAMWNGLYAESRPLVLSNISKAMDTKHQSVFGGMLGGYVRSGVDRIYLNLDHLSVFSLEAVTHNLLHEASHRFTYSSDFNGLYYNDLHYDNFHDGLGHFFNWLQGSYAKADQLTMQQRMNHADSIANFVDEVAEYALRHESSDKKKHVYPDRELIQTDVGRLFTAKKPISKLQILETISYTALAVELGYLAYRLL